MADNNLIFEAFDQREGTKLEQWKQNESDVGRVFCGSFRVDESEENNSGSMEN